MAFNWMKFLVLGAVIAIMLVLVGSIIPPIVQLGPISLGQILTTALAAWIGLAISAKM